MSLPHPPLTQPTQPLTPLTLARAIPAQTDRDTLLALAKRYADRGDPVISVLPRDYQAAMRRRLILLLAGDVEELAA